MLRARRGHPRPWEAPVVSQGESAVTDPQVSAADQAQAGPVQEAGPAQADAAAGEFAGAGDEAGDEAADDAGVDVAEPGSESEPGGAAPGLTDVADLELEGEIAADYIEGL